MQGRGGGEDSWTPPAPLQSQLSPAAAQLAELRGMSSELRGAPSATDSPGHVSRVGQVMQACHAGTSPLARGATETSHVFPAGTVHRCILFSHHALSNHKRPFTSQQRTSYWSRSR